MVARLADYAWLPILSRALVALGWLGFFAFFMFRKNSAGESGAKRDRVSLLGIALQGVAFAAVWMIQRPLPRAGAPLGTVEIILDVVAPIVSVVSGWVGLSAVRTLGRQWSYEARLVEGHRLVVEGPYRWMRHPIYTAMFGNLLATNFAFGHWLGLVVGAAIYMIGTTIRIRSEETLLRGAFGADYEAYARRVRAMIPGVY